MSETKKNTKEVKYSDEAIAIAEVFKANPNKFISWSMACSLANVPCKSGYLKSVKAILGDDTLTATKNALYVPTIKKVSAYVYKREEDTPKTALDNETIVEEDNAETIAD